MCLDLIEVDGEDLRRHPIEKRKSMLEKLLRQFHPGIVFNSHYVVEGGKPFRHPSYLMSHAFCRRTAQCNERSPISTTSGTQAR